MFYRRHRHGKLSSHVSPYAKKANARRDARASRRALRIERLEDRSMFALLGVAPLDPPIISYDSGGSISYNAATDAFNLASIPLNISTAPNSLFFSGSLNINIRVDGSGMLLGGVAGDDLLLTGDVDVNGDFVVDYFAANGPLLRGEILAFGSQDSGGTTDAFDYRFSITGGQLAFLYAGKDLGATTASENSTFAGDFGVNFGGNAKGLLGGIEGDEPGIMLRKLTNGVDAQTEAEAAQILPGDVVTWTYEVTNTGNTSFAFADVSVVDDNGTPLDTLDDFMPAFDPTSDVGSDGILSPGETWTYEASAIAQDLSTPGATSSFHFAGGSALDGPDGNIRTYSADGLSVRASAWSRSETGVFDDAWLGAYGGGLGVTDNIEGDGGGDGHTVDNVRHDNYVLFEFSESVIVDSTFLGYVVNDSDLTIWIGTAVDPFNNHLTLSDALLAGLGFTELNLTDSSSTRWADFNAGNVTGNVLVIAARTDELEPCDRFKIEKLKVQRPEDDCYENFAVVRAEPGGVSDSDVSYYCNPTPGIMIEKLTNGNDADNPDHAPQIEPGDVVTWTYKLTNTGTLAYAFDVVVVTDDNGTPNNSADDFEPTFDATSDVGADSLLSPGEVWTYTASAVAQELVGTGSSHSYTFSGNSSTTGTAGNIRTFTSGGVSVHASAFGRNKTTGLWQAAYLGAYGGGLGVTDPEENGTNTSHTVDNDVRDNYVLFEFSEQIVVDSLFLGFVVGDSDLSIWIGSTTDPFNSHLTLSDAVLAGLGFTEVNTGGSSTRTADINAGQLAGNVLVVAARIGDVYDYFKIQQLRFNTLEAGIYRNVAEVVAPGATDEDASHYRNPILCIDVTFDLTGSSSTSGTAGNTRTYTAGGVSVNSTAFSRTTEGTWSTAFLGAYDGGLGVTDGSETGGNGTHRVDNNGQLNYVLFEFSTLVTVDRAFLDSIVDDSDIQVWIGTADNPFDNHLTLNDALLAGLGFTEFNEASNASSRWADFNAGEVAGNVLVIAASPQSTTKNDQFKISNLDVCAEIVKFYVVDASADRTFEYSRGGQALTDYSLNLEITNPRGVATTAAGDKLWIIDGNNKVYVYDAGGTLLGSWAAADVNDPQDITTDGTHIWLVGNGGKNVVKYSNAAGRLSGIQSPDESFALTDGSHQIFADAASYVMLRKFGAPPAALQAWQSNFGSMTAGMNGTTPTFAGNANGIVTDGTHFWVVSDSDVDKVFKYTLAGTLVGSWTIDARNSSPTGITIDPSNVSHIWIVDSEDAAVYRYDDATNRTSGSQAAASVFQLAGGNSNAQGIADPPPGAMSATNVKLPLVTVGIEEVPEMFGEPMSALKDQALTGWASNVQADSSLAATRSAQSRPETLEQLWAHRSRLEAQLTALDAAFDSRDDDEAIENDVAEWLEGEEVTTPDELVERMSEGALAAFGA